MFCEVFKLAKNKIHVFCGFFKVAKNEIHVFEFFKLAKKKMKFMFFEVF